MIEFLHYEFVWRALAASILGGITCGIVGVWVVLLNIPFVGVAMSHSAFAGAVFGLLFGINPLISALVSCLLSALLIGPVADRGDFSPNVSIGIIFSFVLGVAFLGMGFLKGQKIEALNLLWGSILTISRQEIFFLAIITVLILVVLAALYRQIMAVLFNREIAKASGVPEKAIFYLLLFMCGAVVTLNLNTIGGLLVFSLVTSSPLAAYQITYDLKKMYIFSAIFGVTSCLAGFIFSYILNVPSGAAIIIVSSLIFVTCMIFSRKRRKINHEPQTVF